MVPARLPVTIPSVGSTDAMPGALLVQLPGTVRSLSVMVEFTHTLFAPSIADGSAITLTVVDAVPVKPLPSVMVTV